jgi:hypothetical protein
MSHHNVQFQLVNRSTDRVVVHAFGELLCERSWQNKSVNVLKQRKRGDFLRVFSCSRAEKCFKNISYSPLLTAPWTTSQSSHRSNVLTLFWCAPEAESRCRSYFFEGATHELSAELGFYLFVWDKCGKICEPRPNSTVSLFIWPSVRKICKPTHSLHHGQKLLTCSWFLLFGKISSSQENKATVDWLAKRICSHACKTRHRLVFGNPPHGSGVRASEARNCVVLRATLIRAISAYSYLGSTFQSSVLVFYRNFSNYFYQERSCN